jgi:integrase
VEAGHGRTAAKLRSYLSAAYSAAMGARTDPAAPHDLRAFGIRINPIASISAKSLARFNRARDRRLSAEELSALLQRLDGMDHDARRDAIQLSLYLGGQRPAQLLRARPGDVDLSAATITLYDAKGSRKQPRRHVLPLTRKAVAIAKRRLDAAEAAAKKRAEAALPAEMSERIGEWLFSLDGAAAVRPETLSNYTAELCKAMMKEREIREPFELRDLRRTCETMLASLKVSSDVRAMILSHGLGGIQKRHYDFHDYALEMRAALEKWAKHLDHLAAGKVAKVVHGEFGKAKQHA